jgi:hypothetical protein
MFHDTEYFLLFFTPPSFHVFLSCRSVSGHAAPPASLAGHSGCIVVLLLFHALHASNDAQSIHKIDMKLPYGA